MNFKIPTDKYYFITSNYKEESSAIIVEVFLFKDDLNIKVAITNKLDIGIFDSINDLDKIMKNSDLLNLSTFSYGNNQNIMEFAQEVIRRNENLKTITFDFIKNDFKVSQSCISKYWREKEFVEIKIKTKKAYLTFINKYNKKESERNDLNYILVVLSQFNYQEKKLLIIESLRGVYEDYLNQKDKFDFKSYYSINKAVNGKDYMEISDKIIDNYSYKASLLINDKETENENTPRITTPEIEEFDDTYYSDQSDIDQQGPEFWDSL